jgi:ATP-dependent helicase YprA (DUF1998 family)
MGVNNHRGTDWLVQLMKKKSTKELARMVESYRAGYSAAERKLIEERLAAGQLRGLVATNALELGIDVGELDVTLHFGVPLHMHELWQQVTPPSPNNLKIHTFEITSIDARSRFW